MLLCQVTILPSDLAPVGHSAKTDWAEDLEALLSSPAIVNNQRNLPHYTRQHLRTAAPPRCTRPLPVYSPSHTIERAMSVKFEKETIKTVSDAAASAGKGKDDLLHEVGQALTKGGGPNGYLAVSVDSSRTVELND